MDNNSINYDSLHNYFSYVPQDPFIMDDNIITNITFNLTNKKIDIIEIHNRPEYVRHIRYYFPKTKIILFFHNDPLLSN